MLHGWTSIVCALYCFKPPSFEVEIKRLFTCVNYLCRIFVKQQKDGFLLFEVLKKMNFESEVYTFLFRCFLHSKMRSAVKWIPISSCPSPQNQGTLPDTIYVREKHVYSAMMNKAASYILSYVHGMNTQLFKTEQLMLMLT